MNRFAAGLLAAGMASSSNRRSSARFIASVLVSFACAQYSASRWR
jgi:hypothetical protein